MALMVPTHLVLQLDHLALKGLNFLQVPMDQKDLHYLRIQSDRTGLRDLMDHWVQAHHLLQ